MRPCGNRDCKGVAWEPGEYCQGDICYLKITRSPQEKCVSVGCKKPLGHEDPCLDSGSPVLAAKVEAVEACIEAVESRILTAKACRYSESYIAGMEDILIFHRATLERVKKGEGYHSTSQVMERVRGIPQDVCTLDVSQDFMKK